jgi:hypothetical protein
MIWVILFLLITLVLPMAWAAYQAIRYDRWQDMSGWHQGRREDSSHWSDIEPEP